MLTVKGWCVVLTVKEWFVDSKDMVCCVQMGAR